MILVAERSDAPPRITNYVNQNGEREFAITHPLHTFMHDGVKGIPEFLLLA